jgi:hypothetical protein
VSGVLVREVAAELKVGTGRGGLGKKPSKRGVTVAVVAAVNGSRGGQSKSRLSSSGVGKTERSGTVTVAVVKAGSV